MHVTVTLVRYVISDICCCVFNDTDYTERFQPAAQLIHKGHSGSSAMTLFDRSYDILLILNSSYALILYVFEV